MATEFSDVTIIGAGAAGLMAGIWAGRNNPNRRVIILDGAKKPGAKILVSGGGRCNVTHYRVEANDYAGSSRNAIRNILRHFDVKDTINFFENLGVTLKREETGKLFPTNDKARTVLNALLDEAKKQDAELLFPRRVTTVERINNQFLITGEWGKIISDKLILATGGKSLPKTGSDGLGYSFANALGHSISDFIFPALVPLTIDKQHFIRELSGITLPLTLTLVSGTGKKLISFSDSTLCTHFGLSGPSVLNISRYYIETLHFDPLAFIAVNWLPGYSSDTLNEAFMHLGNTSISKFLQSQLPDRLVQALMNLLSIDLKIKGSELTKENRKKLVAALTSLKLPVTGNRGFKYAEVTAGGIPLDEINIKTMESRIQPGLFFCGEILNVDGRIGGFNFQWAWSSGYLAGVSV